MKPIKLFVVGGWMKLAMLKNYNYSIQNEKIKKAKANPDPAN